MRTVEVSGIHHRVADPDWLDPLDGNYSLVHGGRWNAPATHAAIHLNCDVDTARLTAREMLRRKTLAGMPFTFDDLEPDALPVLVAVNVPASTAVDAVSDAGLADLGLPTSYPKHVDGTDVGRDECQPVGARVVEAGLPAISCRSAATGARVGANTGVGASARVGANTGEVSHRELVWFPGVGGELERIDWPVPFSEWFGDY